jgi:DUF971 family protein
MTEQAARPTAIELQRSKALRITWSDGVVSVYALTELRKSCPCATCKQEREAAGQTALPIAAVPDVQRDMATAESVELVGHYALRLRWRDGHDTGIYEYGWLRALASRTDPQA